MALSRLWQGGQSGVRVVATDDDHRPIPWSDGPNSEAVSCACIPANSEVENSGYRLGWLLADCCPKRSRSSGQYRLPNLGEICSGNAGSFCPRTHDLFSRSSEAEISSSLAAWFRQLKMMQSTRLMRVASRVVCYRRLPHLSCRVGRRLQSRSVRQMHPCLRRSKQAPQSSQFEAVVSPTSITLLI